MNIYDQPVKNTVRRRVLEHAVHSLTKERQNAPVAPLSTVLETIDYACDYIEKCAGISIRDDVKRFVDYWKQTFESKVGAKLPKNLHVLILSGPNPSNDVLVLTELGIPPENIWAVEGNKVDFAEAVQDLRNHGFLTVKIHCGSLQEFFSVVPQQFDLIYFDACGPLFGGKPPTWPVLKELLINQRLTSIAALITNFCDVEADGKNEEAWVDRMACWYSPRYDEPEYFSDEISDRLFTWGPHIRRGSPYRMHIKTYLHTYYSDFITKFISECGGMLMPWWRVCALPAARREFFADQPLLSEAVKESIKIPERLNLSDLAAGFGHAALAPDAYPHMWIARLAGENLPEGDPLRELYTKESFVREKFGDALRTMSLIRNYDESNLDWALHNKNACNTRFSGILENFRWFDSEGSIWNRMFCDLPMSHLIVDLLIGQLGFPMHLNVDRLLRLEYTAKQTKMLTDVFIFDQARYMYDIVPSLPMLEQELPFSLQLVIRACMDAIWRHTHSAQNKLFWACSIAGQGEGGFQFAEWPLREKVT